MYVLGDVDCSRQRQSIVPTDGSGQGNNKKKHAWGRANYCRDLGPYLDIWWIMKFYSSTLMFVFTNE